MSSADDGDEEDGDQKMHSMNIIGRCVLAALLSLQLAACTSYGGPPVTNAPDKSSGNALPLLSGHYAP